MTPEQLKKGGWIAHDGGSMPDCYEPDDLVDNITVFTHEGAKPPKLATHKADYLFDQFGEYITHHRPHYSTDELLIMARTALEVATIGLPEMLADNNLVDEEGMIPKIYQTLTLINERLGDD